MEPRSLPALSHGATLAACTLTRSHARCLHSHTMPPLLSGGFTTRGRTMGSEKRREPRARTRERPRERGRPRLRERERERERERWQSATQRPRPPSLSPLQAGARKGGRAPVLNARRRCSTASAGVHTPSSTRASMRVSDAVSCGDMVTERRGVTLSTHAPIRPDDETTEVVPWENPRLHGHLISREGGIIRKSHCGEKIG